MPTSEKIREWIVAVIVLLTAICGAGWAMVQHFENHVAELQKQISMDHDKLADAMGSIAVLKQQMQDHEDRDREEARQQRRRK